MKHTVIDNHFVRNSIVKDFQSPMLPPFIISKLHDSKLKSCASMITNTNMLCYGITMLLHIANAFFLSFTSTHSTTQNLQFQRLYAASGLFLSIIQHQQMNLPSWINEILRPPRTTFLHQYSQPCQSINLSALITYTPLSVKMLEFEILHHQPHCFAHSKNSIHHYQSAASTPTVQNSVSSQHHTSSTRTEIFCSIPPCYLSPFHQHSLPLCQVLHH